MKSRRVVAVAIAAAAVSAGLCVPAANAVVNQAPGAPTSISVDDARIVNGVNYINYSTPVTCAKAVDPEGGQVSLEFGVWPSPTFVWRVWTSPSVASGTVVCYALPPDAALTEISQPAILKVRAKDTEGLWSTTSWTQVVVDKTAPAAPALSGGTLTPNAWGNPASPTLTFTDDGDAASWKYALDAGAPVAAGPTINLSGLAAGYHHIEIIREDKAGNIAHTSLPFGVGPQVTSCSLDGMTAANKAELDAEIDAQVAAGAFTATTAAALKCRPSVFAKGQAVVEAQTPDPAVPNGVDDATVTTQVGWTGGAGGTQQTLTEPRGVTALSTLATKCATGPYIWLTQSVFGATIWTFKINIYRCWDGRRVSNAATGREFKVTNYGKVLGYGWNGFIDDTKFYYTLNGVTNAAYRYTQIAQWSAGGRLPALGWTCDAVLTERVYGDGSYRRAQNKCQ